jgi:hypothetical protein
MRFSWVLIAFLNVAALPAACLQTGTPQAALEELATADKPELIKRHLPETVKKQIDDLPKPVKQRVMDSLLQMKSDQFNGCTVRRADDSDAWVVVGSNGESRGKITLAAAFISGVNAMLPVRFQGQNATQTYIVTMHLDGDEWRIDDFGPWDKRDTGLKDLLHQPTEVEKNNTSAEETLGRLQNALNIYASQFPQYGYPHRLLPLTVRPRDLPETMERFIRPLLDPAFARDPVVLNGYEFHYLLTMSGNGPGSAGEFEITASPVEFGKTGSHHYLITQSGSVSCTSEYRPPPKTIVVMKTAPPAKTTIENSSVRLPIFAADLR